MRISDHTVLPKYMKCIINYELRFTENKTEKMVMAFKDVIVNMTK